MMNLSRSSSVAPAWHQVDRQFDHSRHRRDTPTGVADTPVVSGEPIDRGDRSRRCTFGLSVRSTDRTARDAGHGNDFKACRSSYKSFDHGKPSNSGDWIARRKWLCRISDRGTRPDGGRCHQQLRPPGLRRRPSKAASVGVVRVVTLDDEVKAGAGDARERQPCGRRLRRRRRQYSPTRTARTASGLPAKPHAITAADGTFTLRERPSAHSIMLGGTDMSTGLELQRNAASAPEGSTVVTPLTTLVAAVVGFGK